MNMVVIFTVLLSVLMVMCLLNMLTKSSFTEYGIFVGQTDEKQLNEKYSIPCSEPRAYPSGHVSGNYLNLNGPERQKLLINFIKDKN